MSIPRAIFIDMDGTLLNHENNQVPKTAVDALYHAHEKGIMIFIATGRNKNEFDRISALNNLPIDGFVTMNGAYCYAGDEVIFKNPLHPNAVAMLVDQITKDPFPCIFCELDDMYINITNSLVDYLQKTVNLPIPKICGPHKALNAEIFQIAAFGGEKEEKFLRSLPYSKLTRWLDGGFDLVNKTANKWNGILHMLKYFKISPAETAAVGDAENDIEMLANAGDSVAMGNANESVKKCAKFITSHVDDNGLAKALEYLLS